MLSENLKRIRKSKGLSQGELASKINVVRQTVSKWEQGLSVPDSEMLIRLSEALDTPVNVLLGEATAPELDSNDLKVIAAKLELLNEQYAKSCERRRKTWRTVFLVIAVISVVSLLSQGITYAYAIYANASLNDPSLGIIGGKDGPTAIMVANFDLHVLSFVIAIAATVLSIIGIYKTKRD